MSDDWQAGDLALCVRGGRIVCPSHPRRGIHTGKNAPPVGAVKTIAYVGNTVFPSGVVCRCGQLSFSDGTYSVATRFCKIRPHTPDAEDAETIRLLNSAPVKEPVA